MALCNPCRVWFAETLEQIHLDRIDKRLIEVRRSELSDWESTIAEHRREENIYTIYCDIVTRDRDGLIQNFKCCWLCYRLRSLIVGYHLENGKYRRAEFGIDVHLRFAYDGQPDYQLVIYHSEDLPGFGASLYFRLGFSPEDIESSDAEPASDRPKDCNSHRDRAECVHRYAYAPNPPGKSDGETGWLELLSSSVSDSDIEGTVTQQQLDQLRFVELSRLLDECRRKHPLCRASRDRLQDKAHLPTRLVKMGSGSSSARVVETCTVLSSSEPISYATLSYCWGRSPFEMLTMGNIECFQEALPVGKLSLTVQQALYVAHSLGFEYIWIDCLCILQDSSGDWNAEAARMHHIYQGSALNIVAASSAQVSDGFLVPAIGREPNETVEFELPNGMLVRERSRRTSRWVCDQSYRRAPLRYRGWVLQECFLSTRNLHWTGEQTIWQCNHTVRPEFRVVEKEATYLSLPFLFQVPLDTVGNAAYLDKLWYGKIVPQFSATEVTFDKDRFFALAGLSASFRQRYAQLGIETRYLAGCWEHDILERVEWLYFGKDSYSDQPKSALYPRFYVPSWSWLDVRHSSVRYDLFAFQQVTLPPTSARAKEVFIEYEDPEQPFGPIKSAYIHTRAKVFKIRVTQEFSSSEIWPIGLLSTSRVDLNLVRHDNDEDLVLRIEILRPVPQYYRDQLKIILDQNVTLPWHVAAVCMLMRQAETDDGFALSALMLMFCGEKDGVPCYQRIGNLALLLEPAVCGNLDQVREFFEEGNLESKDFYFV